ncbi:MAG: hypothetical protein HDS84_02385 [Bacteroidales bacterium]|nr:hypothetical protein [Bacteroidales bacterium]
MPCLNVASESGGIFPQTWHATSLHSSDNATAHVGTWRAMSERCVGQWGDVFLRRGTPRPYICPVMRRPETI